MIIERWLPYAAVKRRVIFNAANAADAVVVNPRNVIVQWEAPAVNIRKEIKYLGVIRADPVEYVKQYGSTLKLASTLPQFVLDIATPAEVGVLAAEYKGKSLIELEGQLEGFSLVDLDKEGLGEYKVYLSGLGFSFLSTAAASSAAASSVIVSAVAPAL